MRALLIVALSVAVLTALPVAAQNDALTYGIEYDGNVAYRSFDEADKKGLFGQVHFKLVLPKGFTPSGKDEIVIQEEDKEVKRLPIRLTTMLVLDASAGMGYNSKLDEAKKAAGVFLDIVGKHADTGLILFNHEALLNDPSRVRRPSGDNKRYEAQAEDIRKLINAVQPEGGSAYREATSKALDLLGGADGSKAVVLMTDGVDVNSRSTLKDIIQKAKKKEIRVYTVGIGERGLTTVLVLDQSGSMAAPADDKDTVRKIDALKKAAVQFVTLMGPTTKATLLPFSTELETPQPFSNNKDDLIVRIDRLEPKDGTSLYDATMAGIETLVAANPQGYRAVVVLTDGKDESPGSRYGDQAVIERAKETGVKLFTLGLGRKKEINEAVMMRMARETGGEYFHAINAAKLLTTFENLSRDLSEEQALRDLAQATGGTYHHARNPSDLQAAFEQIAAAVQSDYTVEFKSIRDSHDGTARRITIFVDRQGKTVSPLAEGSGNVRGLVVPTQNAILFLVLLGCVVGFLVLPLGVRAVLGPKAR